jgi:hypothetical protein
MKTKLLRKIRKLCLIKYVLDDYKYNKEMVLFNKKTNKIQKNRWEGLHTYPDLAFVLEELKEIKLLDKYWAKIAYKQFKKIK